MKIDRVSLDILRTGSVINARMPKAYSATLTINVDGAEHYFFSHTDTMEDALDDMARAYESFKLATEEPVPTP